MNHREAQPCQAGGWVEILPGVSFRMPADTTATQVETNIDPDALVEALSLTMAQLSKEGKT